MNKKFLSIIVAALAALVIIIGVCGWWAMDRSNTGTVIDSTKYQAVFFTNGQVYFGKLQTFNHEYMKLKDVYYLQAKSTDADSKNPQQTATDKTSDVELIKLGNEVHGPTDEMIISKDQILFFENLKNDGKVSGSIAQFQTKR